MNRFVLLSFTALTLGAAYGADFTDADYKEAQWLTLRFYGAQRCGNTGNWALKGHDAAKGGEVCHTRDGESAGTDLSGGWHDCGDHWKVAFTMGFSAYTLLKAYEVFPRGFTDRYRQVYAYTSQMPALGEGDHVPDVINEVKVATDYFIKALPDENTFYAECGDPDLDHKDWITSAFQSLSTVDKGGNPRRAVKLTDKGGASAAQFTAALALMARLCKDYGMQSYADSCRAAALRGYKYAKKNCGSPYLNGGFYAEQQEGNDDMIVASTELYFLTGEEAYKTDAFNYIKNKWESGWAYSWNSMWEAGYYNLLKIDYKADNSNYKTVLELFKGSYTTGMAKKNSKGLCFYNEWGSCRYAGGLAFAMMLLYDITKEKDPQTAANALALAQSQVDYILGANEFDKSFIFGFKNSWDKVHHRNLQGLDDISLDKDKEPFKFPRGGALIGGPNAENSFVNSVTNYTTTESGCDYNAGITGALAGLISIGAPYDKVVYTSAVAPGRRSAAALSSVSIRQCGRTVIASISGAGIREARCFDGRGRQLAVAIGNQKDRIALSTVNLANGTYFLVLDVAGREITKRFTITADKQP
jgi:hypothetical protein